MEIFRKNYVDLVNVGPQSLYLDAFIMVLYV